MTDWDDDILSEDKTDDKIIELTDIVNENFDHATGEDVIELTDIVEDGGIDLDLDLVKKERFEVETSFDKGLELEMDDPADGDSVEPEKFIDSGQQLSVSLEQVEAALERVIEKKFADKIETILFEVMENVIEKEISDIKARLQKDFDEIGNV